MLKSVDIFLPKLGESIHSATIAKWLKGVGDSVRLDEPIVEVSTDKVASEIPASTVGVITEIFVQEGEECSIGDLLCRIESDPVTEDTFAEKEVSYFSPAVLRIAKEENITLLELEQMEGSGNGGRVTKQDIASYQDREKSSPKCSTVVQLDPVRKVIRDNVVKAHRDIPQATLVDEIDVTDIVSLINERKASFLEENGFKLTITSILIQLITKALKDFPRLNASISGDEVTLHEKIHMGIAVDVNDQVVVPVLQDCGQLDLVAIASGMSSLVNKSREGNLSLDETSRGTITLTNFGMTGVKIGIPMVRFGEAAILGIGSVDKKTAVDDNDVISVRSMVNISISFDHRIVDGMYVCRFLKEIRNLAALAEVCC